MKHRHPSSWLIPVFALLIALPSARAQEDQNPKLLPPDLLRAEELTREEMALALLESLGEPGYTPPACVPGEEMFNDVPFDNVFCSWIEELARRGITGGCGDDNFCPSAPVNRNQMAVFTVRAQFPTLVPAGLTLTGRWGFDVDSDGTGDWGTSISYPLPMPSSLSVQYREVGSAPTSECSGSALTPTAAPGFLCVYEDFANQVDFSGNLGNSRFGTSIYFATEASGDNYAYGTWAATAPVS